MHFLIYPKHKTKQGVLVGKTPCLYLPEIYFINLFLAAHSSSINSRSRSVRV